MDRKEYETIELIFNSTDFGLEESDNLPELTTECAYYKADVQNSQLKILTIRSFEAEIKLKEGNFREDNQVE